MPSVIEEVGASFEATFGRPYGLMEPYQMEDAEMVVLSMGSTAGTVKDVVDDLRGQGTAAGALKLRSFRPFPADMLAEQLSGRKSVAVLDRCISFGAASSPLYSEVTSALFARGVNVPCIGYAYGLGGREILPEHIEQVYAELADVAAAGSVEPELRYLGLRE